MLAQQTYAPLRTNTIRSASGEQISSSPVRGLRLEKIAWLEIFRVSENGLSALKVGCQFKRRRTVTFIDLWIEKRDELPYGARTKVIPALWIRAGAGAVQCRPAV